MSFVSLLKDCARKKDLYRGTQLHFNIIASELLEKTPFLACSLINMYAKCGAIMKAQNVLDDLLVRNVFSWNALITGYADQRNCPEALNCFQRMQNECVSTDSITFISILRVSAKAGSLSKGKQIHVRIRCTDLLDKDIILGTALVDMYARNGELARATEVLEELPVRDVTSWSALIGGYTQNGQAHQSLNCFEQMLHEGLFPDIITFVCLLKACGSLGCIEKGKMIHNEILRRGLLKCDVMLGNSLVDMYARCGLPARAQEVLKELPIRDVVCWNALISGYASHGQCKEAMNCFEQMQCEGLAPDAVTFISLLKVCGITRTIDNGRKIHEEIVSRGLLMKNTVLGNALLDMYAKCDIILQASQVLEGLPIWDVASWNVLIAGYIRQGEGHDALNCFERMQSEGFSPDVITFICILKACAITKSLEKGVKFHEMIFSRGLLKKDTILGNVLVDMYVKCGAIAKAHQLLKELPTRNAISWCSLMTGYTQLGQGERALNCFKQMQNEGLPPDIITFLCILKACGSVGDIDIGKQIHSYIVQKGLLEKCMLLCNAVVDMYVKCGMLAEAAQVLEEIPIRDIVSWNTLIAGYAQQGRCHDALNYFVSMQSEGISPDAVTYLCTLKACGNTGAVDRGKHIHERILNEVPMKRDVALSNALVNMYAKCDLLAKAREVLEEIHVRNLFSWSALILGYGKKGLGNEALKCFEQMRIEGILPDEVIFQGVLSACSHSGLVNEAQVLFMSMIMKYEFVPRLEHLSCMIMAFGFAGQFDKAIAIIDALPFLELSVLWLALLSTCRKWGNVKLACLAFNQIICLDDGCMAAYVLMANVFAAANLQKDLENVDAIRLKYDQLNQTSTLCVGVTYR